ncbi:hypothetical protein BBAD15_g2631 [Beauveria bassiana D1-5]|uniref:Uncharacterized protein n=1 Tax=Beauveria bassiana D1-5 TaxID=1245745 RepID=A0A0A2WEN7_BEABA|nr:hypothetical protein BBAD15_g2631 [Beauveria bassiana D1-5]
MVWQYYSCKTQADQLQVLNIHSIVCLLALAANVLGSPVQPDQSPNNNLKVNTPQTTSGCYHHASPTCCLPGVCMCQNEIYLTVSDSIIFIAIASLATIVAAVLASTMVMVSIVDQASLATAVLLVGLVASAAIMRAAIKRDARIAIRVSHTYARSDGPAPAKAWCLFNIDSLTL